METERHDLSASDVTEQVQLIQHVLDEVMQEEIHYGIIKGTNKPTLFKAGAEKLGVTFRLAPTYDRQRYDLEGGHREYEVKCTLVHISTGQIFGEGLGLCTTMEKRYRWRTAKEATGIDVPGRYWKDRDPQLLRDTLHKKGILTPEMDADVGVTKRDGQWQIALLRRIENPDLADVYNTILKMAKKRAHTDAILTALAASDIFAQDLEDFADPSDHSEEKPHAGATPSRHPAPAPRETAPLRSGDVSQATFDRVVGLINELDIGNSHRIRLMKRLRQMSEEEALAMARELEAGQVDVPDEFKD